MIRPIGDWVIRTGIENLASLRLGTGENIGISINLSLRQIESPSLLQIIQEALTSADLPPHSLMVEISEKLLIDHIDQIRMVIAPLAQMGVKIAIDNFGTGYSSLNSLKTIPVNTIKIDRSFTSHVHQDISYLSMVQGMISIGQHLGLEVIAEGVEKRDQAHILTVNGCNALQGYYFGHPMKLPEIRGMISSRPQK